MSESNGSKSSPSFHQTVDHHQYQQYPVSSSVCASMSIQHEHHHHFYAHHQLDNSHHQHLHHHHFEQSAAGMAGLTSSSSVLSAAASDSTVSSVSPPCCPNSRLFRCSNRLMTGIVITILPIAITSTLICVFMMQKTNLHQYAIYSFVIFCVAFVFPFALFFFTVILNKIYKFYKREIRSTPRPTDAHLADTFLPPETGQTGGDLAADAAGYGYHQTSLNTSDRAMQHHLLQPVANLSAHHHPHSHQPTSGVGQNASLICYSRGGALPYGSNTPYYYHLEDGTIVAYAPTALESVTLDGPLLPTAVTALPTVVGTVVLAGVPANSNVPSTTSGSDGTLPTTMTSVLIEDSPPSYEMALLCPSVHSFIAAPTPPAIQMIIPRTSSSQASATSKQVLEKVLVQTSAKTTSASSSTVDKSLSSPVLSSNVITTSGEGGIQGRQVVVVAEVINNSQSSPTTTDNERNDDDENTEDDQQKENAESNNSSLPDSVDQ